MSLAGRVAGLVLFGVGASVAVSARTAEVSGVVLDPQGLPVPAARVVLACGEREQPTSTDGRGRFLLLGVSLDDCTINVERSGFAPYSEAVSAGTGSLVLRLRVAAVTQFVNVVAKAPPRRPPGSVRLDEDDFRTLANSTAGLISYARLLSGVTVPSVVYVDGLPGSDLPPLENVARVSINADSFSAEYADGDVATVHITTKSASRKFRFRTGSEVLGLGGRDILGSRAASDSTSGSFGLSGPVPRLPLTFSFNMNAGRTSTPASIQAVMPSSIAAVDTTEAASVNRTGAGALDLYFSPKANDRAHVSYRESHWSGTNLGVGGLALQEAGFASVLQSRDLRATMNRATTRFLFETGASATFHESSTRANLDAPGVSIAGTVVMGGGSMTASDSHRAQWTVKQVVRSASVRPWSAGLIVSGSDYVLQQRPNVAGLLQFESPSAYTDALHGASTGTLFLTRGSGTIAYAPISASPFVQKTVVSLAHLEMAAGVRADAQGGFGALVSPRLSLAAEIGPYRVAGGAGLFVRPIPGFVVTTTMAGDGEYFQPFVATGVSFAEAARPSLVPLATRRARLADNLSRPRELLQRISVERAFGRLVPSVEYTRAQDWHLLGSERMPDSAGWTDFVLSNRAADRHRVHAQARYTWGRQHVAAHYEWVTSHDNTDGPFSFPEQAGNLAAEWAPSAGTAAHNVTVVGSFVLPRSVTLNVSESWHGSSPYNITTGLDAGGNGLLVDRGGRSRNSGDDPGFNAMSLYAFRRVGVPQTHGRLHVNVGVQADNILDNRNYISVGSVAGSSTFGRPLGALPGRSVRVYLNVD